MSAEAQAELADALTSAVAAREALVRSQMRERRATAHFMHEARRHGWGWGKIGRELGVSGVAAQRYYERNRREAGPA